MSENARGLTVAEVAQRFRVGKNKVRGWIARGELRAENTADKGQKPRWVIGPDAVAEFAQGRRPATPKTKRRRLPKVKDYLDG
jgi:excisionase family DNA binding protein